MAEKMQAGTPKKADSGQGPPLFEIGIDYQGAGYTNTQVAHLAGIPISTLQTIIRLEADLGTVRVSNLLSLCRVLNTTIEWLFDADMPVGDDTDAPVGQRLELITLFNCLNTETHGDLVGMMKSLAKEPSRLVVWPRKRD